jgi:hypothetical protein
LALFRGHNPPGEEYTGQGADDLDGSSADVALPGTDVTYKLREFVESKAVMELSFFFFFFFFSFVFFFFFFFFFFFYFFKTIE